MVRPAVSTVALMEGGAHRQGLRHGGGLARYLQEQFLAKCPAGWQCAAERPLLEVRDRTLLGYDPRANVLLERADGSRRLWIEFEISRADPAANHAKFATAHVLRPWGEADAFVSMISAHVARGRRNLGAGMIHVMRQVGIDAFQTLLLPDLDRERIKALNHDTVALQAMRPDVLPEIERVLAVAEPVAVRNEGRLHFAADVFDVLLNLRRWNEEADDPRQAKQWRHRAVRYVVVDPATGWCAPAKFAAYVLLPSRDAASSAPMGIDSGLTFERYFQLDQAEPLFDGHRAWTYLTRRLGFSSRAYGEATIDSAAFDAWYVRRERLLQIDREQVRLLVPPSAFR
ncbi:MAG: hypothetical protein IT305_12175 [Chloroflexi bacterium]|nr:hypothetical protein [Chloroflexota bacterium]